MPLGLGTMSQGDRVVRVLGTGGQDVPRAGDKEMGCLRSGDKGVGWPWGWGQRDRVALALETVGPAGPGAGDEGAGCPSACAQGAGLAPGR